MKHALWALSFAMLAGCTGSTAHDDASAPDASSADAVVPSDAGVDASTQDAAMTLDAFAVDAFARDAFATDAFAIDALTVDAFVTDAARPDAGPCTDSDGDHVCDAVDVCPGMDDLAPPAFADGSFVDPSAWTAVAPLTVSTTAMGVDLGRADVAFDAAGTCEGPTITQTLCMPAAPTAGSPLQLAFSHAGYCNLCGFAPGIVIDDVTTPYSQVPYAATVCLGAAAYGGVHRIGLAVAVPNAGMCLGGGSLWYDDVSIATVDRDTCPDVGEAINPHFDRGMNGWTGATASIAMDGTNPVLHVESGGSCGLVLVHSIASFPRGSHPALRFRWRGTIASTNPVDVQVGQHDIGYGNLPRPTAAWSTVRSCLPSAASGNALDIRIEWMETSCPPTITSAIDIDDVTAIDDPSCP